MEKKVNNPRPATLAVAAFCELMGISRTTTYGLLKSGQIASIRIGRRRLITVESVDRLLAASVREGAQ